MLPRNHPDRIQIAFEGPPPGGQMPGSSFPPPSPCALACPNSSGSTSTSAARRAKANTGDKMMSLVASALAGGDCIDDADVLRAGGTARVLGFTAKAPSTQGTFLRSFRWGHGPPHWTVLEVA